MQRTSWKYLLTLLPVLLTSPIVWAGQQTIVPLWTGVAPGSEGKEAPEAVRVTPQGEHVYSSVHHPSITVYLPADGTASGAGVLVIPGGGHREIWMDHEGLNVASWLSQHGIAAFVLKYRLAREANSTYSVEGTELADAKRAMRVIRSRGVEWHIDPQRLGVIGFSAGGELALLLTTRSEPRDSYPAVGADTIDRISSKPSFEALLYPSIPKGIVLSRKTPPAFLLCGADDGNNVSEGLPKLYLAMKHAGVPVELHILSGVGHGFGIRAINPSNVIDWPDLLHRWLQSLNLLKAQSSG